MIRSIAGFVLAGLFLAFAIFGQPVNAISDARMSDTELVSVVPTDVPAAMTVHADFGESASAPAPGRSIFGEPSTLFLMGIVFFGFAALARRRESVERP